MPICKFCGSSVDKLVNAHIFPRKMISRFANDRRLVVANTDLCKKDAIVQSLPSDDNILCRKCDGGIFSELDKKGYHFFSLLDAEIDRIKQLYRDEFGGIVSVQSLKNQNNDFVLAKLSVPNENLIKLFFLSVLLRMSFSNAKEFSSVKLGDKYNKILIHNIENCSIEYANFAIGIVATLAEGNDPFLGIINKSLYGPVLRKDRFCHHYSFRFANIWCNITVGAKLPKESVFIDRQIWGRGLILIPVIPENQASERPWIKDTMDFLVRARRKNSRRK